MGPLKSSLSIVDNISKLVKFPMDSGRDPLSHTSFIS